MTRFTWGIVGAVLGLVALSLALALLAPSRDAPPDLGTPEGVVLAYGLAVQRRDADQAWALLASSAKGQTTQERFRSRVDLIAASYERVRLTVEQVRIEGDTAQATLVRTSSAPRGPIGLGFEGTSSRPSQVRLQREQGAWRITTAPDPFVLDNLR